ncbi:hypothetical protein ACFLXQ_05255, partial [Chloroflexota bacterium]
MSRKDDLQKLINNHKRRLQKLKEREALKGLDVEPEVTIEIEDIEKKLNKLQPELATEKEENIRAASQEIQKQLDDLEQYLHIPFTNQVDTIELITYSQAPPYYLLDAPAGYGKTELLQELGRRFEEKEWVSAYVCADECDTLPELADALSKELELINQLGDIAPKDLGETLCGQLKIEREDDITKAGVIFLIDLGKKPPSKLIDDLVNYFIPGGQSCLRTDQFFASEHNRFRVVLAGRYLANHKEIISTNLPITIRQLSPFSYDDLKSTARKYLPNTAENVISKIAAHIMHHTGGHPACMASILRLYKKMGRPNPDRFIIRNHGKIQNIIETAISQVYEDIPGELQSIVKSLGIFRYLSYSILAQLIQDGQFQEYSSEYSVADDLTTNYLFRPDILLYNDNHRILALKLRKQTQCTQLARDACEKYLNNPNARIPEMWAIEYLHQYLQHHSGKIDTPAQRLKIRKTF